MLFKLKNKPLIFIAIIFQLTLYFRAQSFAQNIGALQQDENRCNIILPQTFKQNSVLNNLNLKGFSQVVFEGDVYQKVDVEVSNLREISYLLSPSFFVSSEKSERNFYAVDYVLSKVYTASQAKLIVYEFEKGKVINKEEFKSTYVWPFNKNEFQQILENIPHCH